MIIEARLGRALRPQRVAAARAAPLLLPLLRARRDCRQLPLGVVQKQCRGRCTAHS